MSDSEFQRLEKAEQDVLAQIARQKKVCDDLRSEYRTMRDDFLESYNETFRPLQASLAKLAGGAWSEHRDRLGNRVNSCSAAISDAHSSEDIGALQNALKARIKQALDETDSTVNQFQQMNASLRKLEAIVSGRVMKDVMEELQARKQTLEREEERLKSLQDRYDHYFGDRAPKKRQSS
jgi:chromosome segregation ATPase